MFLAKAGFGGAEYLLPGLISEGRRRGLPYGRIAALTSWNPARRFGLRGKGTIAPGYDADLCLVDPEHAWTVRAQESESAQEYTPFEGFPMTAKVTDTFVRGGIGCWSRARSSARRWAATCGGPAAETVRR
ncbi:amidohydrolase family protein [Nonomuraea salmonea]|uniref:amidohydrolase family protein n=1 Tax=Nonomuraea salmonea TaxID=46181 RepID=UPI0031E881B3